MTLTWGARSAEGAADFGLSNADIELDTFIPAQGSDVVVSVTFRNTGDDPGNVTIDLFDGNTFIARQNRTDMAADTTVTLAFDWSVPADAALGEHTLRVELDSNEDDLPINDEATKAFTLFHAFDSDEGDLKATVTETYSNYLQDGHIWVTSSGLLKLEKGASEDKGRFIIEQDRPDQFYIMVDKNGVLHLQADTILRSNRPISLFLMENSRLVVDQGALLEVKRIIARDNSVIEVVEGGKIQANLDLDLANLKVSGTGIKGSGQWGQLIGSTATIKTGGPVMFQNASIDYEVFQLDVSGKLETKQSVFDVEDSMNLKATSSEMTDTRYTRGLTHLTTGSHILTNVTTPRVVVSGDATVQRFWYLTVMVIDRGEVEVPGAEVTYRPTQTTNPETGTTDANGMIKFTLATNYTTAAGDNFNGNYEVKAKHTNSEALDWHALTLKENTKLTLQLPDLRLTNEYNVKLQVFSDGLQITRDHEAKGGESLRVRVTLTYKDASRDPAMGILVKVSILGEGERGESNTDADGMVEITLDAPEDSGSYTIEAQIAGKAGPRTTITVDGKDGTFTGGQLAVILLIILVVVFLVIYLIQKATLSYPTEIARCGGCGQNIPLDSETCPECGEKLEPHEAFDPNDSSWVTRNEEE